MSMINYASREINCKLVYYGPGLGGKTTNLEFVYNKVAPNSRGKLISLATETERTLARMALSPGISCSATSISRRPRSARKRSFTK